MSVLEMKVPSPGESISEVEIAQWLVSEGEYVEKDQAIAEIDSDKATLELPAEESGTISLKAEEGDAVAVGSVVCLIDTSAERPADFQSQNDTSDATIPEAPISRKESRSVTPPSQTTYATGVPSIAAAKIMAEKGITASEIIATGKDGRITKQDVLEGIADGFESAADLQSGETRNQKRVKMSMMRRKIAERLVAVKKETAMLTTFNEIDMKPIMDIRKKYKEAFAEHHDVNLGFMSFFTKACTQALSEFPSVNGQIDGKEMILYDYADIGIAVSSPKGLMVPVVRNADEMSLAQIEREIKRLAIKARDGKITPDEMSGGTFTITNGGVFGSMLSTPIINPPQSAILGMHNIIERPVAIKGKVVIRPIMYLALSYDHRIIDGKESVSFLVKVKELLEDPESMMAGSKEPLKDLLGM